MSRVQQQEPLRFPQNVFTFCHFLLRKSVRQKEKEMEERRKALEEEKNTLTAGASKIFVGFNFFLYRFHPFPQWWTESFFADLAFQPPVSKEVNQLNKKYKDLQVKAAQDIFLGVSSQPGGQHVEMSLKRSLY